MFVPYFSLFNIHSHMPEGENPDSCDRWKLGVKFAELPVHEENAS